MLKETLATFFVKKILEKLYTDIKEYLKKKDIQLLRNRNAVEEALLSHVTYVNNWSRQDNFSDLDKTKSISKIYVDLNYSLNLRRDNFHPIKKREISLSDILGKDNKHIVVLGQPGAGKTTTMKHICQSIFSCEDFHPEYRFPVLVRLRDVSDDNFSGSPDFLFDELFSILGFEITKEDVKYPHTNLVVRECVVNAIDNLNALLILDGFDEISPLEKKEKIIKEFEYLCLHFKHARIILTSRVADYNYSIDNTEVYEISSLTTEQIRLFAKKWLGRKAHEDLLSQIRKSPFYDTAIRPLTMAHLCAIYERYGRIPDKPKNIYKKIVNLLVEEWDAQRMVTRPSRFVDFTPDRKTEFLAVFAFRLTLEAKNSVFSKADVSNVYRQIHQEFSLKLQDEKTVLREIEGQTGLFLQAGFEMFEFAHKSLQEYLAAEYIVRLPIIPGDLDLINLLPNELAISTSISIDASMYFSALVIKNFSEVSVETVRIFLARVILENPDFAQEPLLGAALLYIKRLNRVGPKCDDLIIELIRRKSAVKSSIMELGKYFRRCDVGSAQSDNEIVLHARGAYKKLGIEAPMAIQLNSQILKVLGISNWIG